MLWVRTVFLPSTRRLYQSDLSRVADNGDRLFMLVAAHILRRVQYRRNGVPYFSLLLLHDVIIIIILYYAKRQHNKTQYKRYEKLNTPGMQHQNEHTHTHTHTHIHTIVYMFHTIKFCTVTAKFPSLNTVVINIGLYLMYSGHCYRWTFY